ncbi:MAG: AbrB/MazE/SpoVT family DNA-binding domain-containing protein [Acidobacteriaceae bacterium]
MLTSTTVKVSKKYQIAVPAIARKLMHIKSGDRLILDVQDGIIVLMPQPKDYTHAMEGLHHEVWDDIDTNQYITEERDAWTNSPKG